MRYDTIICDSSSIFECKYLRYMTLLMYIFSLKNLSRFIKNWFPKVEIQKVVSTLMPASAFWYQLFLLWMPDILLLLAEPFFSSLIYACNIIDACTLRVQTHYRIIEINAKIIPSNRRNDIRDNMCDGGKIKNQ